MKLHLSTGGERCVNPFENLNSFMPLALPSWTYPRLKFSSILQFEKKNQRSRRRIRGDRRFGGDELDNLPYESMVRERGFARSRSAASSLAASARFLFARGPLIAHYGHCVIYSLVLRMPGSPVLSSSACFDNYGIDFCARRIFMLTDARVFRYPISGLCAFLLGKEKSHGARKHEFCEFVGRYFSCIFNVKIVFIRLSIKSNKEN